MKRILLVSTILDMERLPELTPEFTISLADFKSVLKLLNISATTVWDGEYTKEDQENSGTLNAVRDI